VILSTIMHRSERPEDEPDGPGARTWRSRRMDLFQRYADHVV